MPPPPTAKPSERIDGWKAIGRFLGRDARTAQRWAQSRGLPIHRVAGDGHSVFARAHELRAWLDGDAERRPQCAATPAPARAPGLLVLPFEYRGPGGSDRAFIGDAVGAEVLNRLAVAPLDELRVLSWTTSRAYARSELRAAELAADLGIRYLVEGGVNDVGSRWSVDVRVVDALDDRVVLADRFRADGKDVLRLHSTIAEAVSGQLALNLAGQLMEPFWNDPVDPAAFLAYVRAWEAEGSGRSRDGLQRAIALADEAITLDPQFTPAYALKGIALGYYATYFANSDRALHAQTRDLARHSMRAGPALVTSNTLDAIVATYYDYDWGRSEGRHRFILERLPSDAQSRRNLALVFALRERWDSALAAIDIAVDLERSPRLLIAQAGVQLWRREYAAAAASYERLLEASPGDAIATYYLIVTLGLLQRDESRVRARVDALDPAMSAPWRPFFDGCVAVAARDPAGIAHARRQVRERAAAGRGYWYSDAMLAGSSGDVDGVIDSLARAIDAGESGSVPHARVEPTFDCARGDPRFTALLRRLNLVG